MNWKDYELLTSQFSKFSKFNAEDTHNNAVRRGLLMQLATSLAIELEARNPRFNRERFLQACGITEDK